MTFEEMKAYAADLPSQGGAEIGPWLIELAAAVPAGAAIVELGCWLGAGTANLAIGALESHAPITTFDRWVANQQEIEKAARFGISLKAGGDTLPIVQQLLKPIPHSIRFTRCNIKTIGWRDGLVGLYVDDATKVEPIWQHAMDVFKPNFIAGAMLVLMDYYFFEKAGPKYAAQQRYMTAHKNEFELVAERMGGTTAAIFRYKP